MTSKRKSKRKNKQIIKIRNRKSKKKIIGYNKNEYEKKPEIQNNIGIIQKNIGIIQKNTEQFDHITEIKKNIQNESENKQINQNESKENKKSNIKNKAEDEMYIVMITPEIAPCAKVGGLGDVVQGLGRELEKKGHKVEVIIPMYSCLKHKEIEDLEEVYEELWCPYYDKWRKEKVFQGSVAGIKTTFITGSNFTIRDNIYGYDDDIFRFTYFSRQALEYLYKTNKKPDIIHCHDWTTAMVPVMLYDIYEKMGMKKTRVVYTIHNNECQGLTHQGSQLLGMVGLDYKEYLKKDKMQDDEKNNCLNLMKGGIVYSNFITAVSPTYAGEIKTKIGGKGLDKVLTQYAAKLGGILNGIDYEIWNPETDKNIAANYSKNEDFYQKYENKAELRKKLNLYDDWKPIIAAVTRLTEQKGLELIKQAIFSSIDMQAQFVLLGSAPDERVNNEFLKIKKQLKDDHNVSLYIGYSEELAHLIYAGSDMFLVPSIYEPCGLTQMIALRYGTVPIVRETGGLADTIFDVDKSNKDPDLVNGYSFRDPNKIELNNAMQRAIRLWYDKPKEFNKLIKNGMEYDFSWKNPTVHYENIYKYITK